MSSENNQSNILSSWKEIAAYLKCGIRTCMRYEEKYGLPVYRLAEKPKTHVFAYKNELDEWLRDKSNTDSFKTRSLYKNKKIFIKKLILMSLILIMAVFTVVFIFNNKGTYEQPFDFIIEGSNLVILNNKGIELQRHDTELRNLLDEPIYREHFQKRRIEEGTRFPVLPYLIIEDINNDGLNEVLFSIQTTTEFGEGRIICFDNKGNELWHFDTGRELKYGSEIFSPDYRIYGFDIIDLNNDMKKEVIAISNHNDDFPTQLTVLSPSGELIGEYWNSGRIPDFECADLDGDVRKEIILAAMNNEYKKAVLIVIDSHRIEGASPQTGAFKCESLPEGTEKYYILLPRTDADRNYYELETAIQVYVLNNKRLSALTYEGFIYFEFSYELELLNIRLTNRFDLLHKKAVREGKIKDFINENKYKDSLIQGILYWDGQNWVSTPTMTSCWKNKALNH